MNANGQRGSDEKDGDEEHSKPEEKTDEVPELVAREEDLIDEAERGPDKEEANTDEEALTPHEEDEPADDDE